MASNFITPVFIAISACFYLKPSYFVKKLRSWSRHNDYRTPKSMQDVWSTSYQRTYDGKKLGYNPDRYILDYFNGNTRLTTTRRSRDSDRLKSSFNDRAKDGFRYWLIERPRPTFCKYKKNWKIWNWLI